MNIQDTLTILVPVLSGLGWIIHQISDLKIRVAVIEAIISMKQINTPKTRKKKC